MRPILCPRLHRLFDIPKLLSSLQPKPHDEREAILKQIRFSKLIVDIIGVSGLQDLSDDTRPALVLNFQGARPSTDEAKVDSKEAVTRARQGSFAWNMNFTFDVAEEEEMALEIELVGWPSGELLGTAVVWLSDLEVHIHVQSKQTRHPRSTFHVCIIHISTYPKI